MARKKKQTSYEGEEPDDTPAREAHAAKLVRDEYVTIRKRANPGFKLSARHSEPALWKSAGRACENVRADPREYVQALFRLWPQAGGPFPNMLAGQQAERLWLQSKKMTFGQSSFAEFLVVNQWRMVKERFGTVAYSKEMEEFFETYTSPLESWFRVMIFPNNDKIYELFAFDALRSFSASPALQNEVVKLKFPLAAFLDRALKQPPNKPEWMMYDGQEF